MVIGRVLSTDSGPDLTGFEFVLTGEAEAGSVVGVDTGHGTVVGMIENIMSSNRMFSSPEAVKDGTEPMEEWRTRIASVKVLGVLGKGISRPLFPVDPGSEVRKLTPDESKKFFGLDGTLNIGKMIGTDIDVTLDISRLIQKHMAVLAMSGAGKSYFIKVLLEELLSGKSPTIVLFDMHGEYTSLIDEPSMNERVRVIDASKIRISTRHLIHMYEFFNLTDKEKKSLRKILSERAGEVFSLDEIDHPISDILRPLGLFAESDSPDVREFGIGNLYIIDMSSILENRKRQLIVYHISNQLFRFRVQGKVPPFLLILEEAHNYAPERTTKDMGFAKRTIETISREGRKFGASICLISQRPYYMSTTALSQCNTKVIFRMTNPPDVKHVEQSSEAISKEIANLITTLRTGEAIIMGEAVNFPVLVRIRKRRASDDRKSMSLEEMIDSWSPSPIPEEDLEAFL